MAEGSKIKGSIRIPLPILNEVNKEVKNIPDYKKKIENVLGESTTEFLEIVLTGAISLGVSDVHFEPKEKISKIRVRVDGLLQNVLSLNQKEYRGIVSRTKLLSGLKLNISDRPQDGRFSIFMPKQEADSEYYAIEVRTSTLPTEYGETIVLRILDPKKLIDVEALGLRPDLFKLFSKQIEQPNGMIIVTGPTGSGKTTTLYAFLKKIQSPETKIITIEDPVEYHLDGISQTQVDPSKGYNFANGLRSLMRQDPDVILVGEIRDLETANIALQAALTGHLVFTTLHTNDAAGTIARMLALGEKAMNVAPAINMAVAQRLIRKICKKCVKMEKVSVETLSLFKKGLKGLSKDIKIKKLDQNLEIPKIIGCKDCNSTGYRGRAGIYETFMVDDEMEKFILTEPSIAALKEKAVKEGMVTMYQDGLGEQ